MDTSRSRFLSTRDFWGPLSLPTLRDCSYYNANGFVWPFPLYDPTYANLQGQRSQARMDWA